MQLALIQGNATATVRHPSLRGQRLLIGQQLNAQLRPVGDPQLMLDQMGAGAGDVVLISSDGRGLRDLIGHSNSPARWYTIGLLDSIENVRAYQRGVTA